MLYLKEPSVTMDELRQIKPNSLDPKQGTGRWWAYLPHYELVEAVRAFRMPWYTHILEPNIALSAGGLDMTAAFPIEFWNRVVLPGHQFWLGVTTSNSGRSRTKFYAGTTHGRMQNTFPFGTILNFGKHSHSLNMRSALRRVMKRYWTMTKYVTWKVQLAKAKEISIEDLRTITHMAGMRRLLSGSRLFKLSRFFLKTGGSLWDLYMLYSHLCKKSPPHYQFRQLFGFQKLIEESLILEDVIPCTPF